MAIEEAFVFECRGDSLVGILHTPDKPAAQGVLMVVGGPQYRVGSHRQFVEFARDLASNNIAVMRFDYRGMGDSTGPYLEFEQVQADIATALDEFTKRRPELSSIKLFGLCDAASAALMHGAEDPRVDGMILMNPWVRSNQTEAQVVIKHYYGQRFLQRAFWKKLFSGQINVLASFLELLAKFKSSKTSGNAEIKDFRMKMLAGAQSFAGSVLLILSGDDLTANEFEQLVKQSDDWSAAVKSRSWDWQRIPEANHTFARSDWKRQVVDLSLNWMNR